MTPPNPYAPPGAPVSPHALQGSCPACRSPDVHRPTFTWWGGALGPKLFSHAVCRACGLGFNRKTGKSNTTAIAIYVAVGCVLGLAIAAAYVASR
jgi:hypothetical protein